jgi:hypothetical protein
MITALDIQEFADAIEKQSNSLEIREQMGVSAREFTLANFGAKQLVNDYDMLYKKTYG